MADRTLLLSMSSESGCSPYKILIFGFHRQVMVQMSMIYTKEFILSMLLITIILAVAPALGLLYYFYRKDTLRPEPKGEILKTVLFGIIIVAPVAIIETLLSPITTGLTQIGYALVTGFIIAAGTEEGFKYLVIRRITSKSEAFDEVTDGIVYTVAISMGFALFENITYSVGDPLSTVLIRSVTAVPLHAIASGIMGYYIGSAKFNKEVSARKGLFLAIGIHGLYDFFLMSETLLWILIFPLLFISWRSLQKLYKKAQLEDRYYGRS